MFVKEISRERHAIANAPANDIANRPSHSLADDVQAGNFDRRECPVLPVERILAWHEKRLAPIAWTLPASVSRARHFAIEAGKLEWIPANNQRSRFFKGSPRALAPVGLADSPNALIGFDFHDGPQRPRRVQSVRASEWRVCDRDGMQFQRGDFHGNRKL
jgi:hypothetical protein